ncbi:MAG: flagellar hook-length control protein FliK [Treponematales bacterium]
MLVTSTYVTSQTAGAEGPQESAPEAARGGRGAGKKDGLGAFAKILDGLLGKAGKAGSLGGGKGGAEAAQAAGKAEAHGADGKGKKVKNRGSEAAGELVLAGVLAVKQPAPTAVNGETAGRETLSVARPTASGEAAPLKSGRLFPQAAAKDAAAAGADGAAADTGTAETGGEAPRGLKEGDSAGFEPARGRETESGKAAKPRRDGGTADLPAGRLSPDAADRAAFTGAPRSAAQDAFPPQAKGAKDGGRLQELRARKLRPSDAAGSAQEAGGGAARPLAAQGAEAALSPAARGEAEIIVELRAEGGNGGAGGSGGAGNGSGGASGGAGASGFGEALAGELRGGLNYSIVREAQVLMRQGGANAEGTIRLSLKPETLGNVKIRIEMSENKIKGHIVVESADALKAFGEELSSLERSFRESGFDDASLDLSLAQEGAGDGSGEGDERQERQNRFSPVFAVSRYEAEQEMDVLTPSAAGEFPESGGINLWI